MIYRKRISVPRLRIWVLFAVLLAALWSAPAAQAKTHINPRKVTLFAGQHKKLKLTGKKSKKKVKWSSSDPSVATVNKKGRVTAKSAGTATIRAKRGKSSWSCKVTVESPSLNRTYKLMVPGESFQLTISGSGRKFTWKSGNTSVATVSKKGVVKAKKNGTAEIRARYDGKTRLTCYVQVGTPTPLFPDSSFRSIAHRGYRDGGSGSNKASAYYAAAARGFDCAEVDLKFTADEQIVCAHDDTFTDSVTGETVTIAALSLAELRQHSYYGEPISTFEEVISACEATGLYLYIDKIPLLTSKSRWDALFDIVRAHHMERRVAWLVTNQQEGETVLSYDPEADLSLLVKTKAHYAAAVKTANSLDTDRNTVRVDMRASFATPEKLMELRLALKKDISFEVWTVNDAEEYQMYRPFVSGITSDVFCLGDFS